MNRRWVNLEPFGQVPGPGTGPGPGPGSGPGPGPGPWTWALGKGPGPGPWAKALGPGPGPWQSIQKICFRARFLIIVLIFFFLWSRAEIENFLRSKALRLCLEGSGIFLILYLPRKDTFENGF